MKTLCLMFLFLGGGRSTVQALKGHETLEALDPSRGFVQNIREAL